METENKPLVSVVLCFYNEEKLLAEAVESVLIQDYQNWELILVDDGSADGSTEIAKWFAAAYPDKIFYLDHPGHSNNGLSASRNRGIKKAQGEYIAFIDADDVWLENKLSYQVDIFNVHPEITVALEPSLYWSSWMSEEKEDVLIPVGAPEGIYQPPHLMTVLYPLGKGSAPCPSGIMVSRSVFDKYAFEESFRGIYQMYEDQAFLCKVYLNETVFVSGECHNKYRQRPSSLVSSVHESGKYDKVRSYYLRWFTDYYKSQKASYENVSSLLKKARMPYEEPYKYKFTVHYPRYAKALVAKVLVKAGVLSYNNN